MADFGRSQFERAVGGDPLARYRLPSHQRRPLAPRPEEEPMPLNAYDHDHPDGTGWIRTATGRWVHLLDPKPDQINLHDIAHALSRVCRFGGHIAGEGIYSVAEHSLHVSAMLRRQYGDPSLTLAGLLHDASEAYLGDMVRPLKQTQPSYVVIERRLNATISAALKLPDHFADHPLIKEADEAALVWEMATVRDCAWRRAADPALVVAAFMAEAQNP